VSWHHIEGLIGSIVVDLGFGPLDVSNRSVEAMVIEPVDPAQGCHFYRRRVGP